VKTCPDCNGDGVIEKGTDDEQQCPTCGGSGFVPDDDDDDDDEEITRTASAGARPRVSSDRYCLLPSRCGSADHAREAGLPKINTSAIPQ
jgi:RecJ-like exonuclease